MIKYNHQVINELFSSFSNIIKTNICIYDDNFDCPNIQNDSSRSCCSYINPIITTKCSHSDSIALKKAAETETPFFYRCHLGFTEIIIPYRLDYQTKIYVLVGPLRNEDNREEMIDKIKTFCSLLKKDSKPALQKYMETPIFDELTYNSIINISNAFMNYATKGNLITIRNSFITSKLNPYLENNIDKNIAGPDIASHFFYTSKQFEYIVKKETGMTPKKYILLFKMNEAKKQLIESDKPLQDIANNVGFLDYNYFIKVFKSFAKSTPLQYRKKFQNT